MKHSPVNPGRRDFLRTAEAAGLTLLAPAALLAQEQKTSLVMLVSPEPPTLASYMSTTNTAAIAATKIYEGLVTYDWALKPQPALARSWATSADGKTMTFELQRNVKFHDGSDFTSADVQFTIMEVLRKVHPRGRVTFAQVEAVETPTPHTVVLKLSRPAPYLLNGLSGYESPIIPKKLFAGTDVMQNAAANKPVGTGPFRFVEWQRGQYIRLQRNESYWNPGQPRLDQIVLRFIGDPATRAAAIEKGEAQFCGMSMIANVDVERLRKLPGIQVNTRGSEVINPVLQLELNTTRKPLDNVKVRQALAYAIDRKFIADNVFYGNAKVSTGPLHSSLASTGLYTTDKVKNYNVPGGAALANRLLDEAGMKAGADGTRFELTLSLAANFGDYQRVAEYMQQAFARIGVRLKLQPEDFPGFLRRVFTNYDYDIMLEQTFTQLDPVIGVHRLYHSRAISKGTVFVNAHRWTSPKVDELLDAAEVEGDPARRASLYHSFQREVVEAAPVIYLNEILFTNIQTAAVQDAIAGPLGILDTFARTTVGKATR